MMTNTEILELAKTYFEESFVEYDEDDNVVVDFIASKENLLKFALAIHEDGYNKGYDDGVMREWCD